VKPELKDKFGTAVPYVFYEGKAFSEIDGLDQLVSQIVPIAPVSIKDRIEKLLAKSKVVLFMKGTPENPQCGFSSKTVALLKQYDGLEYTHFNVFEDNEIREGLKKYSNWPTYPQLYFDSKLVGGIDII